MDLTPDPLVTRLRTAVAGQLAPGLDSDAVWSALAGIDAAGWEAPRSIGGLQLGLTAGVTVPIELGRLALPDPYSGTALAVQALTSAGDPGGVAASLVDGKYPVMLSDMDAHALGTPRLAARTIDGSWTVSGELLLAADAPAYTSVCAPVSTGEGVRLLLLGPDRFGRLRDAAAAEPVGGVQRLDLQNVVVEPQALVDSAAQWQALLAPARIRQAGYLLGLATGAHTIAVRHSESRRQFGQPIGEFQAVGFSLARSAVALRAARLLVERAVWLADTDEPCQLAAAQALALACDTATSVVRACLQVHGASGLLRSAPLHRYYLAVRTATAALGPVNLLWREAGLLRLADRSSDRSR